MSGGGGNNVIMEMDEKNEDESYYLS